MKDSSNENDDHSLENLMILGRPGARDERRRCEFARHGRSFYTKHHEFFIKDHGFCIKTDGFCIRTDGFCIKIDGFCIKIDGFCINIDGLCIKHDGFFIKHDGLRKAVAAAPTLADVLAEVRLNEGSDGRK